jgi:small basic protein
MLFLWKAMASTLIPNSYNRVAALAPVSTPTSAAMNVAITLNNEFLVSVFINLFFFKINIFHSVHFFGAKKRTKEASTLSKPPPIWGGLTAPPVAHSLR